MPYIGNITQDFNVSNAMLDTDSVTSIKIVDGTIEGADIAANLDLSDSQKIRFGAGNDLQIFHDGSNSIILEQGTGNLAIQSSGAEIQLSKGGSFEHMVRAIIDGAVELYYDNSKKFETTSSGVSIIGSFFLKDASSNTEIYYDSTADRIIFKDNKRAVFGDSSDLQIFHDGTDSFINNFVGNLELRPKAGEAGVVMVPNGSTELYYDGVKKLETTASGVTVSGDVSIGNDTGKFLSGASNDLQLYHDSSHSVIDNLTGGLFIKGGTSNGIQFQNRTGNESMLKAIPDGTVELYYDNSKKFETTSTGVTVTGTLETTSGINAGSNISMNDNVKLKAGTGDDLQIYHDGSNSIIRESGTGSLFIESNTNIFLGKESGAETYIKGIPDGGVELYYDNDKKFETASVGVYAKSIMPSSHATFDIGQNMGRWNDIYIADNGKLKIGQDNDLQIYHQGSHSYIQDAGTGSLILVSNQVVMQNAAQTENMFAAIENGANNLYYDNNAKLSTTSQGIEVTSNSTVVASTVKSTGSARADMRILAEGTGEAYLWFDASNGDLSGADYAFVQHKNSDLDLIIANYANDVIIKNRNGNLGSGGLNTAIHCHENGAVELYHDGTKFLETDLTPDTHSQTVNAGVDIGECLKLHVVDSSNCAVINAVDMHHAIVFRGDTNAAGTTVTNGNTMCFREFGDMLFRTGGTNQSVRFTIAGNGNIGAPSGTNIYNASDSRLKKNVVTLDKGLDAIKALRPVSFNWIDGFCDEEKDTLYGFVAQEAQTVDSNLVAPFGSDVKIGEDIENPTQTITDPLRVNEKYVIPMLVKAVQELEAKVAALEAA